MNYYERYCGDYQRDTAHLSLAEHGAYTMLLDTYFSVEKPLPSDLASLYRVCRAMTRLEQQAVKVVAEQFFPVSELDGLRHNARADREIAKARPKIEAARINGRKGGRPPKNAGQETRQETQDKPAEFSATLPAGYADVPGRDISGEPGGKARQHRHQPHHQQEMIQVDKPFAEDTFSVHQHGYGSALGIEHISPDRSASSSGKQESASCSSTAIKSGIAGACCKILTGHGVQGCNPHHPTFLALLKAGASEEEFVQAARNALSRGKATFAYVIGTVKRQREEAAKLVLHKGRLPNRQEMLESGNKAGAQGWLPPELRRAQADASVAGERQEW